MPKQNGTGPRGLGPLTGRGLGLCVGGKRRGSGSGFGRGRGCGRGFGRGLGYGREVTLYKEEEQKILEAELQEIDAEKKEIENRLQEMK